MLVTFFSIPIRLNIKPIDFKCIHSFNVCERFDSGDTNNIFPPYSRLYNIFHSFLLILAFTDVIYFHGTLTDAEYWMPEKKNPITLYTTCL